MPKKRKIPTPVWERERSAIGRQFAGRSPKFFGMVAVILGVVLAIGVVAYGFVSDYISDQQRPGSTALKIGDSEYTVQDFTNRLKMFVQRAGGPGSQFAQYQVAIPTLVEQLTEEAVLLSFAAEQGQTATELEVNTEIGTQLGIAADDPNFAARLQEELTRNGLSEQQHRDMITATVLRQKLTDKFTSELPAAVESVHYRQIQVATLAEADDLRPQIEGGADFAALAATKSTDSATKDKGGDAGWVPRGVLDPAEEDAVFALEPGGLTTFPTQTGAFIFQVLEKQADRAIDEDKKPALAAKSLRDWLKQKREGLTIVNEMALDTGNAEKIRYVINHVYNL